jgi:hypothetical protein
MSGFGIGIPMYFLTLRVMAMLMILCFVLLGPNMYFYANRQGDLSSSDLFTALNAQNISTRDKLEDGFSAATQELLKITATCETDVVNLKCDANSNHTERRLYKRSHLDEQLGGWDLLCSGVLLLLFILYFRYEGAIAQTLNRTNTGISTTGFSVVVKDPPPFENNPDAWQKYFSDRWGPVAFVTVTLKNGKLLKKLAEEWELSRKIQIMGGEKLQTENIVSHVSSPGARAWPDSTGAGTGAGIELGPIGHSPSSSSPIGAEPTAVQGSGDGASAGADADSSAAARKASHRKQYALLLPFVYLCDCISVCVCGETSGASEVAVAHMSNHGQSKRLPNPCWRFLQWLKFPGTRDMYYWRRRHQSVKADIEALFEEEETRYVDRVYVTFETEASQRRCLSELADGLICTYFDLPCSSRSGTSFTDRRKCYLFPSLKALTTGTFSREHTLPSAGYV